MSSPDPVGAALAELDAVIVALEAERARARQVLAGACGTGAESLAVALKLLDDKLVEARSKREAIVQQSARTARMTELTTELRAIRLEVERLLLAGDRGSRYRQLCRRGAALQEEGSRLAEDARAARSKGAKG